VDPGAALPIEHCSHCGGSELKIVAAILERPVIEKILTGLALDSQPPPMAAAREPERHGPGCWQVCARAR
jgi:hypothetical protein